MERKGDTLSFANLKGGVGKTTTSVLAAISLAKKGYKVGLMDIDVQGDATDLVFDTMFLQYGIDPADQYEVTFYQALSDGDLSEAVIHVTDNLDIIPSNLDLLKYEGFLNELYADLIQNPHKDKLELIESKIEKGYSLIEIKKALDEEVEEKIGYDELQKAKEFYLKEQIDKIKGNYDYIIIDVPPTISIYSNSAMIASDYVVIVMETQMKSYRKAMRYSDYLAQFREKYNLDVTALGVLPVIMDADSDYDKQVVKKTQETFGEDNVFKSRITRSDRIKRFDWTGITDNPHDPHDIRIHSMYDKITDEVIERIQQH